MYNRHAFSFLLNLGRLQAELLHQSLDNEDEILLAIAGVKQVVFQWLHYENLPMQYTGIFSAVKIENFI